MRLLIANYAVFLLAACNSADPLRPLAEVHIALDSPTVIELAHEARPIVEVSFGGSESIPFLVDSGADSTLIDEEWATRVGLRVDNYAGTSTISGSGDQSLVISRYAHIKHMQIGPLEVNEFFITATNDDIVGGFGFGGVIGQDLLSRFVSIFDMSRGQLHLLPAPADQKVISEYLGASNIASGKWLIEPTTYKPRPFLPFTVNELEGEPLEILIDTGADSCSFPRVAIDALDLEPLRMETFHGIGGTYEGGIYEMTDFKFAGYQVSFEFHQTPLPYGILGMDVLGEFVFLLDPKGETCWLHHRNGQTK